MKAVSLFRERFGGEPDGVWLAPGRANLMGEHTDYNEGFVLPFALGQGVTAAASRNPDRAGRRLTVCSRQEPGDTVEVDLDGLAPGRVTGWAAYPAGVAWALEAAGHRVPGACIAIDSDVPAGAGLSSSAALECATALALTSLAGLDVPRAELVTIARRAENEFAGVPTGIMDQSASLLCRAGHALLLDCRTLETSQVPFDPAAGGAGLLLINTRARHELADGEYGRRRAECEEAARRLGIRSLRDLTDLADTGSLTDPVLRRRVRHVFTDNQRVLEVVALLRAFSWAVRGYVPRDRAAADAGARLAARRLRGVLAGSRCGGGGGRGGGGLRSADDRRGVRRLGARAGARGGGRSGFQPGLRSGFQPGFRSGFRSGQGRRDRSLRPARLDRAGVPRCRAVRQRPAAERLGADVTGVLAEG